MNIPRAGEIWGRWEIIEELPGKRVRCRCVCGTEKALNRNTIRYGQSLSCGCLNRDGTRKHGMTGTSEYHIWQSMRGRCQNPNNGKYHIYGGRGITVCERWQVFINFYADMGPKPFPKATIERKDNDGHYNPDNCSWATYGEQNKNRRRYGYRILTYKGMQKPLGQWAEEYGMSISTLWARLRVLKMPIGKALTMPVQKGPRKKSWRQSTL